MLKMIDKSENKDPYAPFRIKLKICELEADEYSLKLTKQLTNDKGDESTRFDSSSQSEIRESSEESDMRVSSDEGSENSDSMVYKEAP